MHLDYRRTKFEQSMLLIGFCKFLNNYWSIIDFEKLHFSDRFRTAINVFGDSIGCAIVQHLSRKELSALDSREEIDTNKPDPELPLVHFNGKQVNNTSDHVVITTYDQGKENGIDSTKLWKWQAKRTLIEYLFFSCWYTLFVSNDWETRNKINCSHVKVFWLLE